ncbi:hypothetical protein RN001_014799 [Aquatica leii]|uniref:SHSP domain-containing protein n=1 Tax=Aquatica leii TaxID=1421715 RepID=A0AAN7NUX8_9COLE|nr:hypothetical protein RN001_014799 [Aquatica leii]
MSFLPIIVRDIDGPLGMLEQQMRMAEDYFPHVYCSDYNNSRQCNRRNEEICPYLNDNHRGAFNNVRNKHELITQDKEKFLVRLNLQHYTPEEINVKVVNENMLVVEAKHESKDENGSIFRHLTRQFLLPDGYDSKKVETKLAADGTLFIATPKKTEAALIQERIIPVTHIETKSKDIDGPLGMLEQQMRMAEDYFPHVYCSDYNNSRQCNRRNEEICPYLNDNHRGAFNNVRNKHELITQDKEKFLVRLNLQHYTPEEINVKVVNENMLVVEAKHESKDENGSIFRHLTRQFLLPDGYDSKKVETKLAADGTLFIATPKKTEAALIQERIIPVTHIETKSK